MGQNGIRIGISKSWDSHGMMMMMIGTSCQWEFQEPKLEVPTIYKAYIRPM